MNSEQIVLGYIREHLLIAAEMDHAHNGLIAAARLNSLEVDTIFVEHLQTSPDAFAAMIEKLHDAAIRTVIVPGFHHFAGLGSHPITVLEALKSDGTRVIFAPHVD